MAPRDPLAPQPPGAAAKRKKLFSHKPSRSGNFAMIQPVRNATISSAALRAAKDDSPATKKKRRRQAALDRSWQQQALDMADLIGELGYLLNLKANVVALCDFPIRRWDEKMVAWVPNEPGEDGFDMAPVNVMEAFIGPSGGRAELVRRASFNLFTTGETTLTGTVPDDEGDGILWEFLSVDELYVDASGNYVRRRSTMSEGAEPFSEENFTARCWRSSPRFTDLADSEVKRVLPICAEILALTAMVDATLKSRLSAKMLFMPDELDFADPEPGTPEGEEATAQTLSETLAEHMGTPADDPGSLARITPLIIQGKGEFGAMIRVIDVARELDGYERDLRQEALGRLAQGLDTPPEVMRGMAQANHWSSTIIDDSFTVKHIQPVGQLLADFITIAYLRPMLEAYENMTPEEAKYWRIDFDVSAISARADEARSARDLADLLSDEAVLVANGFSKADMVTDDELRDRRLWQLILADPAGFKSLIPQARGMEGINVPEDAPPPVAAAPAAAGAPVDEDADPEPDGESPVDTPSKVDKSKPSTNRTDKLVDAETGSDAPQQMAMLGERLAVAANFAYKRGVERNVARIVSRAQGGDELKERLKGTPKMRCMSLMTEADLERLAVKPNTMFDTAFDDFAVDAYSWVRAALPIEPAHAQQVVDTLVDDLKAFGRTHLLDKQRVYENGLNIPASLIDKALLGIALALSTTVG